MIENEDRKKIIISAINYFEGGPLTILIDCLEELSLPKYQVFQIIVLVHKISLFEGKSYPNNIVFKEFPSARKSYFIRLFLELIYFKKLSKQWNVYLWFSLHDISPNVKAAKKVVYWQSPSPFYQAQIGELFTNTKLFFHSFLYKYVLQLNHQSNDFIVVQSFWIKEKVIDWFKILANKIIVASPILKSIPSPLERVGVRSVLKTIFFYPSLPRTHKNFEALGRSCEILLKQGITNFELILTIDGTENNYAKIIFRKFKHIHQIKFAGILNRNEVFEQYQKNTALLFPSKLETWGLPISEFKNFQKPILVADLPYAKETVGDYDKVMFLDVNNPELWANAMRSIILDENIVYQKNKAPEIPTPKAHNWTELFDLLLK